MTETTPDLFAAPTGGGAYPKMDELEGRLVLLNPSKIETVPGYQGKGTQERATADCTVFEDDGSFETYDDMYFSQAGIVPSLRKALKPGNKPFVLGRVQMFPSKSTKEKGIDTPEKLQTALSEWARKGGKGDKPQFAWGLAEFSEQDAAHARAYLASLDAFAAPTS